MALPTVEAFERASLKAWPSLEEQWDGGWVRRAAGGYTKRANSVQCFDPEDGEDADLRIISASSWMVIRKLKPVFRITPLSSPDLNETLDDAGWQSIDPSHLFAMELGEHLPDAEAQCLAVLDPVFLAAQQKLQGHGDNVMTAMTRVLAAFAVPATGVVLFRDGEAVSTSVMAVADGIVLTGNVVTDSTRRRQGLGVAMMHSGLAWARGKGATVAALNVQADNAAAQALYSAMGYAHQYDYDYRIPGGQP